MSFRRTAEVLRSWLGRQERYWLWRPLEKREIGERCYLSASTVHRWLDRAGKAAEQSIEGQLKGISSSEVVGTDGLWARLRGGTKRVALIVVDSVTGVIWPPVIAVGEESEKAWQSLFERARQAGLHLEYLRGVTSDGARGLLAYLNGTLTWVQQQRCVVAYLAQSEQRDRRSCGAGGQWAEGGPQPSRRKSGCAENYPL